MILSYNEQEAILGKYNLQTAFSGLATTEEKAVILAEKIGYPVVMKISSQKHLHRTEIEGVFLDVENKEDVLNTFSRLTEIEDIDGVIIQKKIKGLEFIIGAKIDASFGPVIMFGSGGVMVELFNDVAFRVAPINKNEALDMIEEIKGKKLLEGFRGFPEMNKNYLADILVNVSSIIYNENIKEVDFNPVIVNEEGGFICDVKMLI